MACGCSHMQRGRCVGKSDVTFRITGMCVLSAGCRIPRNSGQWQATHRLSIVFKSAFWIRKELSIFLFACDQVHPAVYLPLFQSFSSPLTIITTITEAMRDARQKRHTISGIDPHPSPHREKTWVQGLHNSDWTVRSIGCSISRFHGNSPSKDRAPPFIYTCLLLPATLC